MNLSNVQTISVWDLRLSARLEDVVRARNHFKFPISRRYFIEFSRYTFVYSHARDVCCFESYASLFRFSLACFARNFYSSRYLNFFFLCIFGFLSLFFSRYCNEKENKKYFSHLSFISDISNFRRFCFIVTRRLGCFC